MPASKRTSGVVRLLLVALPLAGGACASSSGGAGSTGGGAFFGASAPASGDHLTERAVVPARIGGRPTAAIAARVLESPGWPVASVDTVGGSLVSRWLAFRQGSGNCWIRLRLLVLARPAADSVELGTQVWLQERIGTGPALQYARSVLSAFRADVLSGAGGAGAPGAQLRGQLNYTDQTADFIVCGTSQQRVGG